MALQRISLANFRESVALVVNTMYVGLAAIIAFGVVYNNARFSLSERARELASLRVLGFTRGEVFRIFLLDLSLLTLLAQPRMGNWLRTCLDFKDKRGQRSDARPLGRGTPHLRPCERDCYCRSYVLRDRRAPADQAAGPRAYDCWA
jgi:hypothetical protein